MTQDPDASFSAWNGQGDETKFHAHKLNTNILQVKGVGNVYYYLFVTIHTTKSVHPIEFVRTKQNSIEVYKFIMFANIWTLIL